MYFHVLISWRHEDLSLAVLPRWNKGLLMIWEMCSYHIWVDFSKLFRSQKQASSDPGSCALSCKLYQNLYLVAAWEGAQVKEERRKKKTKKEKRGTGWYGMVKKHGGNMSEVALSFWSCSSCLVTIKEWQAHISPKRLFHLFHWDYLAVSLYTTILISSKMKEPLNRWKIAWNSMKEVYTVISLLSLYNLTDCGLFFFFFLMVQFNLFPVSTGELKCIEDRLYHHTYSRLQNITPQ